MRFSGAYITNITITYCPSLDTTVAPQRGFTLTDLKAKHLIWSILGVAAIAAIGMLLGLFVNAAKSFYNKRIKGQPIRYINLHADTRFA